MRITNSLFYTNAVNNYQTNMQELYKTNTQIASGLKIQNSFEDSGVYVDTMRLNDQISSLEQVKESSSKAQTYANNTDGVLNQFTDALVQFKTKIIQASNASNSPTSLGAIANELSALKDHMISLGNTSINGQYIFSGTAVTVKPLDSNGNYKGNDGSIEAIIGSGVKLPYNINGKELFLGQDSDYNKVLSTNVKMLNQTLLHPTGNEASQEVFLTGNNTIQDMVGDSNVQVNAYDIAGTVEAGDVYSITINGIQISHTVTTETTSDEITTALMNKINDPLNNVDTIVRATTSGSKLVLTSAGLVSEPSIVTSVTNAGSDLQTFTKDNAISSTSNEAIASFYVSGKNSIGDTFSKELQLSVGSKVLDLLKEIGQAYGNTSTNSVVDVSMNANGQIEIKDLKKGNSLLEFNIFGAIDRNAIGVAGNASQTDIDVLMAQNSVDIIKFDKSNFLNINTASSISSNQDINNPGVFRIGAPMTLGDGTPAKTTTTLKSFMGNEVNQMNFSGTDNLGNPILPIPPNDVLKIDNTTTVGDLLTTIGNIYGSTARLENGQIIVEGDQSLDYAANQLTVKIDAQKGAGEGEIQSINITAGASNVNADIITVTLSGGTTQNVNIPAGGGTPDEIAILIAQELTANIPFASPDDNIASIRASGGKIVVDYNVSAGNISPAVISITNAGGTGILSGSFVDEVYVQPGITEVQSFDIKNNTSTGGPNSITIAGQSITINDADTPSTIATNIRAALGTLVGGGTIASVSGSGSNVSVTYVLGTGDIASNFLSPTSNLTGLNIGEVITEQNGVSTAANVNVFSTFDSMNYERRGFEKDGNLLSSNISQIVKGTSQYATNLTKLSDVAGTSLDGESLELNFTDKDGNLSKATINFSSSGSTFSINDGIEHGILNSSGTPTLSSKVTYQQLSDVISMAVSGVTYDSVFDATKYSNEYEENISNAKNSVEVNLNSKGQLEIYDKHNSKSKIEFSMFDPRADKSTQASSLTFMANDAIAVEKPKLDFFQNLDEMIVAVRNGNYNMDANSGNPRNIGMENSISRLDHIMDHITKKHTKIGSFSNALSQANDRSQLLSINIQTIRSEVIDVDIGEAYMKFNQLSNSYQAMLSTVAKINSMSLLNYM